MLPVAAKVASRLCFPKDSFPRFRRSARGIMTPARIAYVITGLGAGGAETVVSRLLSRQDRRRFRPMVISLMPCEGLPLERKIAALGVEVHSLGVRPGRPTLAALPRLLQKLRAFQPALICGWERSEERRVGKECRL